VAARAAATWSIQNAVVGSEYFSGWPTEAANRRSRCNADQRARRVEKCPAGKPVVHRRRRANHLIDGASVSGAQRSADHRYDAGAGGDAVTP